MSLFDWFALLLCAGVVLIVWELARIGTTLRLTLTLLESLEAEVFHLAQEQNPSYGVCSKCGRREVVRHVVPKGDETGSATPEMFYCQNCWWMSSTVQLGDDNKRYKDRFTERDRLAASAGPG
jgi:hypothetical protein